MGENWGHMERFLSGQIRSEKSVIMASFVPFSYSSLWHLTMEEKEKKQKMREEIYRKY